MEALAAFFLMPLVFWAFVVVAFLTIALGIDNDKGDGWGWATIGSAGLIYLGSLQFGFSFGSVKEAATTIAIGAAAYIVIGVLWSFAKWYFKLANIRDTYVELKNSYRAQHKLPEMFLRTAKTKDQCEDKDELIEREEIMERNVSFYKAVNNKMRQYDSISMVDIGETPSNIIKVFKPAASHHKSSITQWIAFWPISFVWTMINDPVRKIANYVFSRIKGTFQKMSDSMFAGV